jgi:hypothetical protein
MKSPCYLCVPHTFFVFCAVRVVSKLLRRLVLPGTPYLFINNMERSQDHWDVAERFTRTCYLSLWGRTGRPCRWRQHVPAMRASYLERCLPVSWSSTYTLCTQAWVYLQLCVLLQLTSWCQVICRTWAHEEALLKWPPPAGRWHSWRIFAICMQHTCWGGHVKVVSDSISFQTLQKPIDLFQ